MNHESYKKWVDAYVRAWNTNDPDDIAALFASDARYFTAPFREPWKGRDEIVKCWLGRKDEPGDAEFTYEVIVATDEVGIVRGRTRYKSDGTDYSNLWEVRLDPQGLCREFVEWWMVEGARPLRTLWPPGLPATADYETDAGTSRSTATRSELRLQFVRSPA